MQHYQPINYDWCPDLCKLAKVILIFKNDNPLPCKNSISLLLIYVKSFKVIYKHMYNFLAKNNLCLVSNLDLELVILLTML